MATKYWNIPVDDEETYIAVREIAESNGFGRRGMGMQIKNWVARELAAPVCNHPKTAVEVQWMPTAANLGGKMLVHKGLFCPTCNRVYRDAQLATLRTDAVSTEALAAAKQDPYGQPAPVVEKKRKAGRTN